MLCIRLHFQLNNYDPIDCIPIEYCYIHHLGWRSIRLDREKLQIDFLNGLNTPNTSCKINELQEDVWALLSIMAFPDRVGLKLLFLVHE
jgi:hypothetical protein